MINQCMTEWRGRSVVKQDFHAGLRQTGACLSHCQTSLGMPQHEFYLLATALLLLPALV
jgi:hypothetical protein